MSAPAAARSSARTSAVARTARAISAACATTPAWGPARSAACPATAAASGSVPHSSGVCSASRRASVFAGFMNGSWSGWLRSASASSWSASGSRPAGIGASARSSAPTTVNPTASARGRSSPGGTGIRGSTSRARPAPAEATGPSVGAESTTSAPRRTARCTLSASPTSSRSAVCATTTSSGPIQLGVLSTASTGIGATGASSALSRPAAGPDAPRRRSSTSARGRLPASSPTPASAAACAADRTWAPAVAAERSTPPVSSAVSARGSASRVSSSTVRRRPVRPAAGWPRRGAAPGCRPPPGTRARTRCR